MYCQYIFYLDMIVGRECSCLSERLLLKVTVRKPLNGYF